MRTEEKKEKKQRKSAEKKKKVEECRMKARTDFSSAC